MRIRAPKDFWSGVMFCAFAAVGILTATGYSLGTAGKMGPGYFPIMLGGLLIVFGLVTLASGLREGEPIAGSWSLRALIVLPLSLVLFGLLMTHAGFIPAMVVLIVASAAASREFRFLEVLLFAIGLTALAVAVSDQLLDTLSGLLGEGSVRLAEANGSSRTARAANGGRRR